MSGISLGEQTASRCDTVQSDQRVTDDFMRRPGSSVFKQTPSILTLDDFRCHKVEAFQKRLKEEANTETVIQSLDRNINKEFERGQVHSLGSGRV